MSLRRAWIGLGSNLGDREGTIRRALEQIECRRTQVHRVSSLYETEPMYLEEQPPFLNAVAELRTSASPLSLLSHLRHIESSFGRVRTMRNGPRTLDLDLLLYERVVMRSPRLQLPHPRISERRFVLEPLAELAPGLRHPVSNATIAELLAALPSGGTIRLGHIGRTTTLDVGQQ